VLAQTWQTLSYLCDVLGLVAKPEDRHTDVTASASEQAGVSDAEIEALVQQRQAAREAKNFAESDRLRDELNALGVVLIDQPDRTTRWHR
jgi:cysteinyl-tRNA synthetase